MSCLSLYAIGLGTDWVSGPVQRVQQDPLYASIYPLPGMTSKEGSDTARYQSQRRNCPQFETKSFYEDKISCSPGWSDHYVAVNNFKVFLSKVITGVCYHTRFWGAWESNLGVCVHAR